MSSRLLLMFLAATLVSGQTGNGKVTIRPEDEVAADKRNDVSSESKVEAPDIIVEGEDGQRLQLRKPNPDLPGISSFGEVNWESGGRRIPAPERSIPDAEEKRAQLRTQYGSYQAFGLAAVVARGNSDGALAISYQRSKYDSEGRGGNLTRNSAFSEDSLSVRGDWNVSPERNLRLQLGYLDQTRGLQSNSVIDTQFRRGAEVTLTDIRRYSRNARLDLLVNAASVSSRAEAQLRDERSSYYRGAAGADWQYIFGNRNSIISGFRLAYGEISLFENSAFQVYRSGEFYLRDIIPLGRYDMGGAPWQLDLTIGVQTWFAQGMAPVAGPQIVLDSFVRKWHSRLEAERRGQLPDPMTAFMRVAYAQPYYYTELEDQWLGAWRNSIRMSKSSRLRLDGGIRYYNRFFNLQRSDLGLYTYNPRRLRIGFAEAGYDADFGSVRSEFLVIGEYFADSVDLRAPVTGSWRLVWPVSSWEFAQELKVTGRRFDSDSLLEAYALVNLQVKRSIAESAGFYLLAENIGDVRYRIAAPYATSGFRFHAGFSMEF